MKKKEIARFPRFGKFMQISRITRLAICYLLLGVMTVSAKSMAQHQKVSLDLKDCTVMQLFEEIQRQTGLYFFYDQKHFTNHRSLSVKADKETVENLLKKVFDNQKVEFLFEDNTVIVRPQQEQQVVQSIGVSWRRPILWMIRQN